MSLQNEPGQQEAGDSVLHQDAHEALIDEVIEDASAQAALTDIAALTGGEPPTEVEFNALATRVNVLTQVLRDLGAIPTA